MKTIQLTKGHVALIDDEDLAFVSQWKWYWSKGYAVRRQYLGGGKYHGVCITLRMHREIIGACRGQEVDHINCDKLDNLRSNIRFCTRSHNAANMSLRSTNTSGYRGVCWDKKKQMWGADLTHLGKHLFGGYFKDKIEAARAWNEMALELRGEFAWLNPLPTNQKDLAHVRYLRQKEGN